MNDIVERLKSLDKPRSLNDWSNVGEVGDEAAAEIKRLRLQIADVERLREDERLTWDAQHKRQASMNAHLAALVTDAQEELRKCQQDAIQLQARLAECESQLRAVALKP